jgi:hypothetical protein
MPLVGASISLNSEWSSIEEKGKWSFKQDGHDQCNNGVLIYS